MTLSTEIYTYAQTAQLVRELKAGNPNFMALLDAAPPHVVVEFLEKRGEILESADTEESNHDLALAIESAAQAARNLHTLINNLLGTADA